MSSSVEHKRRRRRPRILSSLARGTPASNTGTTPTLPGTGDMLHQFAQPAPHTILCDNEVDCLWSSSSSQPHLVEELEHGATRRLLALVAELEQQENMLCSNEQTKHHGRNQQSTPPRGSDDDDDDDDEFGEFQSAVVVDDSAFKNGNSHTREVVPLREEQEEEKTSSECHSATHLSWGGEKNTIENSNSSSVLSSPNGIDDSSQSASATPLHEEDVVDLPITEIQVPSTILLQNNTTEHETSAQPLSLQLSCQDHLHSPEGRFTRRRQEQQQPYIRQNSALQNNVTIPETTAVLESLPWHAIQPDDHLSSFDADFAVWDESMTRQLCDMDEHLHQLQQDHQYQQQLSPTLLLSTNEQIHTLEATIRLAQLYYNRTNESLQDSREGIHGMSVLLRTMECREHHQALDNLLTRIQHIHSQQRQLEDLLRTWSLERCDCYRDILATAADVSHQLIHDAQLGQLECLAQARTDIATVGKRIWERVFVLGQSAAVYACRRAGMNHNNWSVYYNTLWDIVQDLPQKYPLAVETFLEASSCDDDDDDDSRDQDASVSRGSQDGAHDPESVVSDEQIETVADLATLWTQRLVQALCYEMDRSFAVALLDPVKQHYVEESFRNETKSGDYAKELASLTRELGADWGDDAKLRTLTHNLVTIRFVFQADQGWLPCVVWKLCQLLANVLHAHMQSVVWHRNRKGGDERVLSELIDSRKLVWKHCEECLTHCLDEYMNFSSRGKLLVSDSGGFDDDNWTREVEELHIVTLLLDRFLSLKSLFYEDASFSDSLLAITKRNTELGDKMGDVCRRLLSVVHVEAMNNIGRKLASETWILGDFCASSSFGEPVRVGDFFRQAVDIATGSARLQKQLYYVESAIDLRDFQSRGNPFDVGSLQARTFATEHVEEKKVDHESVQKTTPVFALLEELFHEDDRRLAPNCVSVHLLGWFGRLLRLSSHLPFVSDDVSVVFANICDLYVTTVFRICTGSSANEEYVLAMSPPTPFVVTVDENGHGPLRRDSSQGSNVFDQFRKGRSPSLFRASQRTLPIPKTLDAEICYPTPKERVSIDAPRKFILRAQESLNGYVNLDKVDSWISDFVDGDSLEEVACHISRVIEKRHAAAASLYAVAALVKAAHEVASLNLAGIALRGSFDDALLSFHGYATAFCEMTPSLVSIANKISTQRAIGSANLVREILGSGGEWEERKLHEHANDYVDVVSEKCALVWGYLSTSAKLPRTILANTWNLLLSSVYLCMLEGFARIPFCSTEGRALMALDLASFTSGIRPRSLAERFEHRSLLAQPPPANEPEIGMAHVDIYIKVYYFPAEDALDWIRDNYESYQLNHVLALLASVSTEAQSTTELSKDVFELYDSERSASTRAPID